MEAQMAQERKRVRLTRPPEKDRAEEKTKEPASTDEEDLDISDLLSKSKQLVRKYRQKGGQ